MTKMFTEYRRVREYEDHFYKAIAYGYFELVLSRGDAPEMLAEILRTIIDQDYFCKYKARGHFV